MSAIDIYILVGILAFGLLGFRDGFFKKIFGIFGMWGGLILAVKLMNPVSDNVMQLIDVSSETAVVCSFVFIFLMTILAVNLFYRWFGRSADDTMSIRTRIMGTILGFSQGVVSVSLFLIMLSIYDVPTEQDKSASLVYDDVIRVAPIVFDYSTRWMPTSAAFFDVLKTRIEKFTIPK